MDKKYEYENITIKRCEDDHIWIVNGESVGEEHYVDKTLTPNITEEEELIIAFASFLGYEPSELLNLDIFDIELPDNNSE